MIFAEIEAVTSLEVLLRDYRMVTHPNNDYILNALYARCVEIMASDHVGTIQYIKENYNYTGMNDFKRCLPEFLDTYLEEKMYLEECEVSGTVNYSNEYVQECKKFVQELWEFFTDSKLENNLCAREYRRIIKSTIYANDWEEEDWVGIPEEELYMGYEIDA